MMKILHLRDSGGIFGAERILLSIVSNLDRRRFTPSVLCMVTKGTEGQALMQAVKQHGIEGHSFRVRGRFDPRAIVALRKMVLETQVDVIHCHDFKSNFYGLLGTLGTETRRVATAHGSTLNRSLKYYQLVDTYFTLRFFHKVITVSQKLTEFYRDRGFPRKKIVEVLNGLDVHHFETRVREQKWVGNSPEIAIPEGRTVLGTVGRLFPEKGVDILLKSFCRLQKMFPDLFLLVVGDGPERGRLESLSESLGVGDHVFFTGVLENVVPAFRVMDIFVIPSLREGLPNVILEAIFFGKRVVATDVGSVPLVIEDGKTGMLVKPGSVDSLTKGIQRCLEQEAETLELVVRARERLDSEFTSELMVGKTEKIYIEVMEKKDEN